MKLKNTMRAVDLLKNKFGVSQRYKYELKDGDDVVLEIFWHPLTIAEREAIQKKNPGTEGIAGEDFALGLMIEKALDENDKRLFADGDRAALRREITATVLQDIQLAILSSGTENKVEEAKAEMKSKD